MNQASLHVLDRLLRHRRCLRIVLSGLAGCLIGTALALPLKALAPEKGTWSCVTKTLANGQPYTLYITLSHLGSDASGYLEFPSHRLMLPAATRRGEAWLFRDQKGRVMLELRRDGDNLDVKTIRGSSNGCMAKPSSGIPAISPMPLPPLVDLSPNGLAKAPPMGWNSWNKFSGAIDDATVRQIADAMVSTGMRDAGYTYVNIDDSWEGNRDSAGNIHSNSKFPDMAALAAYVHTRGLKLGIYSSPGPLTCAGYPGSYGHEAQDARTFAAWGIDYLKYDWCSARWVYHADQMRAVYQKMGQALQATGRPIVYSLCQYGFADVWEWGTKAGGNLWRTTGDIGDSWSSMQEIASSQPSIAPFETPGGWNDPDMLEVGNGGMTEAEYRTHLSLWSILRAPLLSGNDLRKMDPKTLAMLVNRDVLALDQDTTGKSTVLRRAVGPVEVWQRQLEHGDVALLVMNMGDAATVFKLAPSRYGLEGMLHYQDLWTHEDHAIAADSISFALASHEAKLLRVRNQ